MLVHNVMPIKSQAQIAQWYRELFSGFSLTEEIHQTFWSSKFSSLIMIIVYASFVSVQFRKIFLSESFFNIISHWSIFIDIEEKNAIWIGIHLVFLEEMSKFLRIQMAAKELFWSKMLINSINKGFFWDICTFVQSMHVGNYPKKTRAEQFWL